MFSVSSTPVPITPNDTTPCHSVVPPPKLRSWCSSTDMLRPALHTSDSVGNHQLYQSQSHRTNVNNYLPKADIMTIGTSLCLYRKGGARQVTFPSNLQFVREDNRTEVAGLYPRTNVRLFIS